MVNNKNKERSYDCSLQKQRGKGFDRPFDLGIISISSIEMVEHLYSTLRIYMSPISEARRMYKLSKNRDDVLEYITHFKARNAADQWRYLFPNDIVEIHASISRKRNDVNIVAVYRHGCFIGWLSNPNSGI